MKALAIENKHLKISRNNGIAGMCAA